MAKHRFIVELDVVGASPAYVKEYVLEALGAWGGQRRPSDPLFSMHDRVRVRHYRERDLERGSKQ